jgi:hypothetical protein
MRAGRRRRGWVEGVSGEAGWGGRRLRRGGRGGGGAGGGVVVVGALGFNETRNETARSGAVGLNYLMSDGLSDSRLTDSIGRTTLSPTVVESRQT